MFDQVTQHVESLGAQRNLLLTFPKCRIISVEKEVFECPLHQDFIIK